jgi:hypothetical protein
MYLYRRFVVAREGNLTMAKLSGADGLEALKNFPCVWSVGGIKF